MVQSRPSFLPGGAKLMSKTRRLLRRESGGGGAGSSSKVREDGGELVRGEVHAQF